MTKCAICRTEYKKWSMTQKVCLTAECAIEWARREKIKQEKRSERGMRNAIRERREDLKSRSQWVKEAQVAFNAFIRARDSDKPCICCGKPLASERVGGGFDAGHYRSTGSAPHLRFDERNCHGQTKQCNRYGAGRAVDYRIGLISRIGLAAVEQLEADQAPAKWSISDLKQIKIHYRKKLKEVCK